MVIDRGCKKQTEKRLLTYPKKDRQVVFFCGIIKVMLKQFYTLKNNITYQLKLPVEISTIIEI